MLACVRSLGERSKWIGRRLVAQGAILGFCCAASMGQQKPPTSSPGALHEFPLVLQQSIESGKATIGTKVQAKLAVATMFEGTVIPRNAVFSGVVIESTPKSAKEPAKLAIRMETVEWKHGSSSMMAYLLPLYCPTTTQAMQNFGDARSNRDLHLMEAPVQLRNRPCPINQFLRMNHKRASLKSLPLRNAPSRLRM